MNTSLALSNKFNAPRIVVKTDQEKPAKPVSVWCKVGPTIFWGPGDDRNGKFVVINPMRIERFARGQKIEIVGNGRRYAGKVADFRHEGKQVLEID